MNKIALEEHFGATDTNIVEQSAQHFRANFYLTTSGNFRTPALLNTIQEVGADRLLLSADYPFEDMREASEWLDRLKLNENDHLKIAAPTPSNSCGCDRPQS